MKVPLYVDLDSTLIYPLGQDGNLVYMETRPDTEWFFQHLHSVGPIYILTHGVREHASRALPLIPGKQYVSGIIAREDMKPVSDAMEQGRTPVPVAKPGPIFDDYGWGSWLADLKSAAIGVRDKKLWIQVERFDCDAPDRGGLKKAYGELVRRFG